jgi:hypothetical protein
MSEQSLDPGNRVFDTWNSLNRCLPPTPCGRGVSATGGPTSEPAPWPCPTIIRSIGSGGNVQVSLRSRSDPTGRYDRWLGLAGAWDPSAITSGANTSNLEITLTQRHQGWPRRSDLLTTSRDKRRAGPALYRLTWGFVVELRGFEPLTSCMPSRLHPQTGPDGPCSDTTSHQVGRQVKGPAVLPRVGLQGPDADTLLTADRMQNANSGTEHVSPGNSTPVCDQFSFSRSASTEARSSAGPPGGRSSAPRPGHWCPLGVRCAAGAQ